MKFTEALKAESKQIEQQKDQEKFSQIREHISVLKEKQQGLKDALAVFDTQKGPRSVAAKMIKNIRSRIHQGLADPEARPALEKLNIRNKQDLEKSQEPIVAENEDVIQLKHAKSEVSEKQKQQDQALADLKKLLPDTDYLGKKEIISAAEDYLKKLETEQNELYLQTPEGQKEQKEKIISEVKPLVEGDLRGRDHVLVHKEFFELSSKYGEDKIRPLIIEEISVEAGNQFDRRNNNEGFKNIQIKKTFDKIDHLDVDIEHAKKEMEKLDQKREKVRQHIVDLVKDPEQLKAMERYFGRGSRNPLELSDRYLEHFDDLLEIRRQNYVTLKDSVKGLKKEIVFTNSSSRSNLILANINPEYLFLQLEAHDKGYDKMLNAVNVSELQNKLQDEFTPSTNINPYLEIDEQAGKFIQAHGIVKAREHYREKFDRYQKEKQRHVDRILKDFNYHWFDKELQDLKKQKSEIISNGEAIEFKRARAAELLQELAKLQINLEDYKNVNIVVAPSKYYQSPWRYIQIPEHDKEWAAKQAKAENLGKELQKTKEALQSNRLFKRSIFNKGKLNKEEISLQKKFAEDQSAFNEAQQDFEDSRHKYGPVKELANSPHLDKPIYGEMTVGEFFKKHREALEQDLNARLSPEEQNIYNQYKELERKRDTYKAVQTHY